MHDVLRLRQPERDRRPRAPVRGALTGASRPPLAAAYGRCHAVGDVVVTTRIDLEHAELLATQGRLEEAFAAAAAARDQERLGEVQSLARARLAAISEQGGVTTSAQG